MGITPSQTFVSLPEVAARLGIAWPTAYRRLLRGEFGPVRRLGGRYLIAEADVDAYVAHQRELGTTAA